MAAYAVVEISADARTDRATTLDGSVVVGSVNTSLHPGYDLTGGFEGLVAAERPTRVAWTTSERRHWAGRTWGNDSWSRSTTAWGGTVAPAPHVGAPSRTG